MQSIEKYFKKYENLFSDYDSFKNNDQQLPHIVTLGSFETITSCDFFGFDLSRQSIIMLCCFDEDDIGMYKFSAICVPKNLKKDSYRYSECPIYLFDTNDHSIEKLGNFKSYVSLLLSTSTDESEDYSNAKKSMNKFSSKLIDYDVKVTKINNKYIIDSSN